MKFILELNDIGIITYVSKLIYMSIFSYHTALKMINKKKKFFELLVEYFFILIIAILCGIIKYKISILTCIIALIVFLSLLFSQNTDRSMERSILIITIALGINYALFMIASTIGLIPNIIFKIDNVYISFIIIAIIYTILLFGVSRVKRFKNGLAFLQKNVKNDYIDMIIFSVSITILFIVAIISNYQQGVTKQMTIILIIFSIIMFSTIQKSLQLYYKQKLLVKELDETKEELENTKKELKQVEEENLNFSKKSHTLAHRQKSLEHKIEELTAKAEISAEEAGEVKDRLKEIEKDLYKETATVELSKTEIPEIDDMLKYMQSECIKNKIEFELQLTGNIYHMLNNLISKEDLEILLADHIKDAIIAINHSDNINRSILVRLGEIDGIYSLYIYDSGVEFEKETLENLGKKPSTTHADEGGTGMGFMNTFDTLRKYEASLTINELDKPNKDNYTKVLIFKFDKKNEFKIISYRQEELN